MKKLQTEFLLKDRPITEARFDEMLGVLPPAIQTSNAFLVGEPVDHGGPGHQARFQLFFTEGGKYYDGGLATIPEFKLLLVPINY